MKYQVVLTLNVQNFAKAVKWDYSILFPLITKLIVPLFPFYVNAIMK